MQKSSPIIISGERGSSVIVGLLRQLKLFRGTQNRVFCFDSSMGESNKDEVTEISVSMQTNKNPINLLQKFTSEKDFLTGLSESEQPDLNLRLSLGGSYGEIPVEIPLIRSSSSVTGLLTQSENAGEFDPPPPTSFLSLSRSASLPTEAEQEKIKIRELQSLRRMEAKRRMLEKQRSGRAATEEEKSPALDSSELAAWAAASAANSAALCRAILKIKSLAGNQTIQGLGSLTTATGLTSSRSLPVVTSGTMAYEKNVRRIETKLEIPSKRAKSFDSVDQGTGMEVMKQMPSVTTTGNGPNGRKIEGFLYKYMKGQVSIVCVCHGSFLSPAEFVKHAGGGEVANPMRHITVCSTSLSF